MTWPVINDDKSEAKNNNTFDISLGSAILFKDVLLIVSCIKFSGVLPYIISVLVKPGATLFTRILNLANSIDKFFESVIIDDFDEEYAPLPKLASKAEEDDKNTIFPIFF